MARKKVAQSTLPIDPDPAAGKDAVDDAGDRPAIQGEIVEIALGIDWAALALQRPSRAEEPGEW